MKKPSILNTPLGCRLCTSVLLHKNLSNHRKIIEAAEKGILLNGCHSPYQYLKRLLQEHPELMDKVAILQDRNITYKELWDESETLANYLLKLPTPIRCVEP